jgi:glycosyltransferase involved in cell wall biosynthesis
MDASKPLVSVFIVTYNSSDYIIEALDSVRNQTYPNIELVVSDDCSTDNSNELFKC